jgi:cephalosporin-C deacetylase
VRQTLAYYDGISFAPRITCPIILNIGLQDNVCPPETGYALFDAIASKDKKLYEYDQCGHDAGKKEHDKVIAEFFAKHLQQ